MAQARGKTVDGYVDEAMTHLPYWPTPLEPPVTTIGWLRYLFFPPCSHGAVRPAPPLSFLIAPYIPMAAVASTRGMVLAYSVKVRRIS